MTESPYLLGGGLVSTLVVARYLWAAQVIARWARVVAIVLVLAVVGAVAGVVDVGRLVELAAAGVRFL